MTTAAPIRIELVSVPATDNTLGPQERSRLLKSTRKLEAVLGTTPLVIEALPARRKREGGIFHSPSSSISCVEDLMTAHKSSEHDYVFIRSNGCSAPYQHQYLPPPQHSDSRAPSAASFYDASLSASSSRSASPMHTPSKKQRRAPPAPLDVQLALDISSGRTKKSKGPQPLSQPLLLRLRSVPTEAKSTSRGTKPYPAMPLSPANSTFTVDTSITSITLTSPPASPRSPRSRTKSSAALTDREKRKKMAKLARTLGENVPPELVFGQKAGKRRSSVSGSFVSTAPRVGQTLTIGEVPAPQLSPAAAATATTSSTTSSPASIPLTIAISREIETSKCASFLNMDSPATSSFPSKELGISGKGKRKHRPRSLTLGSSSAFAAFPKNVASSSTSASKSTTQKQPASHTRGTTSLDVQRPSRVSSSEDRPLPPLPLRVRAKERVDEPAFARVEITPMRVMTGGEGERSEQENEDWRRKEREWSGEWNLRDMEGVTRALRALRGR